METDRDLFIASMDSILANLTKPKEFKGLKVYTSAKRASVMSEEQLFAYSKEFELSKDNQKPSDIMVTGIGRRNKAVGTALIQIPFKDLKAIIYVEFIILSGQITTLLSMKYMMTNELDISIQVFHVSCGNRTQQLEMRNYFSIYIWTPADMDFLFYTEEELWVILKNFGHPSMRSIEKLLQQEKGETLEEETKRIIARIAAECDICNRIASSSKRSKLSVRME